MNVKHIKTGITGLCDGEYEGLIFFIPDCRFEDQAKLLWPDNEYYKENFIYLVPRSEFIVIDSE